MALITLLTPVLALLLGQALNEEIVSARMALGSGAILARLALFHWGEAFLSRKAAAV